MKVLQMALLLLLGALLLGTASCNKQDTKNASEELNADRDLNNGRVEEPRSDEMEVPEQPCAPGDNSESDGAAAARRIPDFQLRSPEGDIIPVSSLYGRPLVINFWGDWCPPCVAELPVMNKIYNERKSEFDMIAVSVDSKDGLGFWKENKLDIPLYFDVDGKQQLGLTAMPTTFFLDSGGKVVGFQTGEMTETDFNVQLKGILLPPMP